MASIGVKLGIDGEAEYRKQLNNIITTTKTLDKQLAEVGSAFDDETQAMEKNAAETELLQQKAQKLAEEVEMMQQMVDAAAEKFGENSTECQKWEASLASAQTELNNTNTAIDEHIQAADDMQSALGQLTSTISEQESQLDLLRDEYINAILEFGEGSDEASILADKISNVSDALDINKQRLNDASQAADGLTGKMNEVSDSTTKVGDSASETLVSQFMPSIQGMADTIEQAGVVGAIGAIVSVLKDIGTEAYNAALDFEQAVNDIQRDTLATDEVLKDLEQTAKHTYMALADKDASMEEIAGIVGTLNTRLGLTGEEAERATTAISQYATMLNDDGVEATNNAVDVMKLWGLATEDSGQNVDNLIGIMDKLVVAQADADISSGTIFNSLTSQAGAWQSLGFDIDEAISMMVAYRDAGGNVNDLTTAVSQAVKNFSGNTNDLKGAWTETVNIMSNSKNRFATLQKEIGKTGLTIEDVFGAKKAGQMIDVFSKGKVNADKFSEGISNAGGTIESLYKDTRTFGDKVSNVYNTATTALLNHTDLMKGELVPEVGNVGDAWNRTWHNIGVALGFIDEAVEETTENIKYDYSEVTDLLADPVDIHLEQDFNDLETSASSAVQYIYGEFDWLRTKLSNNPVKLKVQAPEINYQTTTSGNGAVFQPQLVRHMEFAQAYDHAMILSAPTIFGAMGNQLLVGGDRPGNEIVVGERHLTDLLAKVVNRGTGVRPIEVNVYGAEGQSVEQLSDLVIDKIQMEINNAEAVYA